MKPKSDLSTSEYNSRDLKKRIHEYSKKVKKKRPALSSSEPTGSINKTGKGF